jgi:predicted molibdopterin-dependent oxidoreductase YjgC
MSDIVECFVDGRPIRAAAGSTVAAALANAGLLALRSSVGGESRGALCAMGVCQECRVVIDRVAQRRACMTVVADGMVIERRLK